MASTCLLTVAFPSFIEHTRATYLGSGTNSCKSESYKGELHDRRKSGGLLRQVSLGREERTEDAVEGRTLC